jgi:hypothetical protein
MGLDSSAAALIYQHSSAAADEAIAAALDTQLNGRQKDGSQRESEGFGTHHSHDQPRRGDGTLVSYEQAGRHLGHRAVAERCVVVIAPGTLRIERALPWR